MWSAFKNNKWPTVSAIERPRDKAFGLVLPPLFQTYHLKLDQKQHDLEMPHVGMGSYINQLLPLSVMCSLPHALIFLCHV